VGLGPTIGDTEQGQIVGLDGSTGQIWLAPESKLIAELQTRHEAWQAERLQSRLTAAQPAITRDGHRIEIAANIGGLNDITIALQSGAEGVGLFRSEFLFLDRATAPTEDEQTAVYRQVAVEMGDAPVIIRTLDVGGDKPLPYFDLGHEDNPFLGWRGIRFTLESPEIFKPQLRAILRASAGHNIRLMFPMVSTLAEVEAGKAMLAEAQADLRQAGIPFDEDIEVGIMVEVPAAAVVGDQLARAVDFFSIGTNDLAQYVMAADRGNARVAALADAFQPALLRSVASIVEAAHTAGIWVGMCGELAGDARAAPVLVGLGLDELSMNGPSIPSVKTAIRQLTLEQARHIAAQVLDMESAAAIKAFLQNL
jgi:phosphoenolpyruvate-protein phosphotransferase